MKLKKNYSYVNSIIKTRGVFTRGQSGRQPTAAKGSGKFSIFHVFLMKFETIDKKKSFSGMLKNFEHAKFSSTYLKYYVAFSKWIHYLFYNIFFLIKQEQYSKMNTKIVVMLKIETKRIINQINRYFIYSKTVQQRGGERDAIHTAKKNFVSTP